jgi:phospholipid/cholesterol/gamma-HCH transport system substrate-binding protein
VLAEPFTIERTSNAVDLDQLLNTLDDPTSTALAAMVTTLGEGLQGNGDTVAGALKGMAPTFQRVDQVSALLDQQNKVVDHLVVQLQRNLDQFAPPIDSLVDAANQTVGAVAASRQGLNDSLVEFPSTLISARQALGQLATTADNTTPVLRDIRPVTGNLKQVSHELKDFSDAASPALDSLPEVLHRVDKLLDEARPVVNDLKPAASDLSSVSDSVGTIGHQLTKHKNGQASQLENLMSGVANWAMSTSSYDGLSHYFRAYLYISPTSGGKMIAGGLPAIGPHKPFDPLPKDPRGGQDPSGHSGRLPYVPGLYPQPTPDVSTGRGEATDQRQGFGDKPSPLTPSQEGGMFDSLLGGGK